MKEAKTSTAAALPWLSPGPLLHPLHQKYQLQDHIVALILESLYHAPTLTLPSPSHLRAPESEGAPAPSTPKVTKVLSLLPYQALL